MADFVSKSTIKSQVRKLTSPFATLAAMGTVVGDILVDNPWNCTPYTSGGANIPGVSKSKEAYTGKIIYENNEGKQVGYITVNAPTQAAFNTNVSTILANTALETAMGGTASHDSSGDRGSISLKCHTAAGELYNVGFTREQITVSSYEDDSILTTIETWADTKPELA